MEKLVDEGLTKSIGVSNFNSQQIQNILDIARIKPVANQVGNFYINLFFSMLPASKVGRIYINTGRFIS